MTRDDIIRMAREADDIIQMALKADEYADKNAPASTQDPRDWQLVRDMYFARLAMYDATVHMTIKLLREARWELQAEREACAKMVDHILMEGGGTYGDAIRARGAED